MQLRLVGAQPGYIEHETADLHQPALIVVQAKSVDQHMNGKAILAAQGRLEIAQVAVLFHHLGMLQALVGRKIKLRRNINLQQFFAAGVAQHAEHGVVDFDKAAGRSDEEKSFLNVVEQLPV